MPRGVRSNPEETEELDMTTIIPEEGKEPDIEKIREMLARLSRFDTPDIWKETVARVEESKEKKKTEEGNEDGDS